MHQRPFYETGTGTYLVGRNVDWNDMAAKVDLWLLPRGLKRDGGVGKHPVTWTSKFGSVYRIVADGDAKRNYFDNVLDRSVFWVDVAKVDLSNGAKTMKLGQRRDDDFPARGASCRRFHVSETVVCPMRRAIPGANSRATRGVRP